ncbi:hypothetical protein KXP58_000607 [Staphylococcus pseudintermedius]|nr:hypothetical protein [Staphylococcus pseudintermedius]EHT7838984.1 hypothetical protein [Staphylococcus pseudintermedius]EIM5183534.1 hypothetical protein [Staphylococcus pseudintermedius]EKH7760075.1 hypothetical protein [Staphylococcus pseudintermedius]ELI4032620.1 hypothetical protein [Staphylococcus pseudintermedius]
MEIKDLKINDEVSVKVSTQRLRDTDETVEDVQGYLTPERVIEILEEER